MLRSAARWFMRPASPRPAARRVRLSLEELEQREVPAVIMVTSWLDDPTAGDGEVSLREAVFAANSNSDLGNADFAGRVSGAFGDDEVVFDPAVFGTARTITLANGQMSIAGGARGR